MKTHHAAVESLPAVQEHWGAVGAMSLCVALLIAAEFMPVSLLTPIARDLGASDGQAGLAISISGLFAVIASLLVSHLGLQRRAIWLSLSAAVLLSIPLPESIIAAIQGRIGIPTPGKIGYVAIAIDFGGGYPWGYAAIAAPPAPAHRYWRWSRARN